MIRFVTRTTNGETLVGLGITRENVARLKAGRPILISLQELVASTPHEQAAARNTRVAIFYGEDEDAITKQFEDAGVVIGEFRDERARA